MILRTAGGWRSRIGWGVATLAVATIVLGVLAVLAPVRVDDPVVTWPQAGQQPVSTIVPLSPYRPLELTATVPCAALEQSSTADASAAVAGGAAGPGEALRTLPADAAHGRDQGLVVAAAGGRVTVVASGATLVDEPLPTGACTYQVRADGSGIEVTRDGMVLAQRSDLLVPQVAELVTSATGAAATGLSVQLHTDARYQSSPTTLKIVLLVAHALSLLALLATALLAWPGLRRAPVAWPRPRVPDALVAAASVAWMFLAPVNIDDSWYLLMSRNAAETGAVGNYINMFNSAENPFVLSQYAMQAWGVAGSWSLLWMRVLPLVYGLLTYVVLRVLLGTLLRHYLAGRSSRLDSRAPWALALAHLVWWLPYGMTLRPEPLIVLGGALVLALSELGRLRRSVGLVVVATAVAAVTLTASPTALVAAAPLLLHLPWGWRWLRATGWLNRVAAVLALGAATTALVPVGLADATLGDVIEGTSVRTYYYFRYRWYEEFQHYVSLMSSPWSVRLPVLLTLAVLVTALVTVGSGRRLGPLRRLALAQATVVVLALVALAPTPSKWVNHFGAIAAPATVLLALALLSTPLPRRSRTSARVLAAGFAVVAASAAFAGPNSWRPFSDWGQPFGTHVLVDTPLQRWSTAPQLGLLQPRSPLLWLVVAGLGLGWAWRRRTRGTPTAVTADRTVLWGATALGVVLSLVVFVVAPLRQQPGPSVASVNLDFLTGDRCGLAPHVQVDQDGRQQSAATLLADSAVLADQVTAALWPCVRQVQARDGMVQAPRYRIQAGEELEAATAANAYTELNGGVFAAISRTATGTELDTTLVPSPGAPRLKWGHLEELSYPLPVGLVDVQVGTVQRSGWARLPTLATVDYTGRDNNPHAVNTP